MANKKRLIDVNALVEQFTGGEEFKSMAESIHDARFVEELRNAPTVDAVEVVHGRWEYRMVDPDYRYYKHECSICGFEGEDFYRYCPNCGAKMDGGNEDV